MTATSRKQTLCSRRFLKPWCEPEGGCYSMSMDEIPPVIPQKMLPPPAAAHTSARLFPTNAVLARRCSRPPEPAARRRHCEAPAHVCDCLVVDSTQPPRPNSLHGTFALGGSTPTSITMLGSTYRQTWKSRVGCRSRAAARGSGGAAGLCCHKTFSSTSRAQRCEQHAKLCRC